MGGDIGGGGGGLDSPSTPPDVGDFGGAAGVEKGVEDGVEEGVDSLVDVCVDDCVELNDCERREKWKERDEKQIEDRKRQFENPLYPQIRPLDIY
jgi:hypothetical protein